jgi:hypothetical protein
MKLICVNFEVKYKGCCSKTLRSQFYKVTDEDAKLLCKYYDMIKDKRWKVTHINAIDIDDGAIETIDFIIYSQYGFLEITTLLDYVEYMRELDEEV